MSEAYSPVVFSRRDFLKYSLATGVSIGATAIIPSETINTANVDEVKYRSKEIFKSSPSWEQDFSALPNGKPSSKVWNYTTGNLVPSYNNEAETYTDRLENVRIENGLLIIEALKASLNGRQYSSGRIDTQGNFDFRYGKLEVELKIPNGIGTWPAAWLLPTHPRYNPTKFGLKQNGGDNWLLNGEIDFMETVGSEAGLFYPDVHTVEHDRTEKNNSNPFSVAIPNDSEDFHTYGVEKLENSIVFTLNGSPYHRINKTSDSPLSWPFDQDYYLIINLAMGGTWGGMSKDKFPPDGIDNSKSPWVMQVKSIAYYEPL